MIDLNDVGAEAAGDGDGKTVELVGRNEEPYLDAEGNACTMRVLGKYAPAVRRATDQMTRRAVQRGRKKPTPEDIREGRIDIASSAVVAWSGIAVGGQDAPCTPANVKALLLKAPWLLDQVEAAIEEPASFTKSASTS